MARLLTLDIDRGTTYQRTGTFSIDGVATSLVGAIIRFTMKTVEYDEDMDDSTAVLEKNITNGGSDGTFVIPITPEDTAELTPGSYFYDIKVDLDGDGTTVYKIDEGKIKLDGSPTNRLA